MSHTPVHAPSGGPDLEHLNETERHRLLADEQRRRVLAIVEKDDSATDLSELAAELVAVDGTRSTGDPEARRQVEIALHHSVLPQLDDFGVLAYDPDDYSVRIE